MWSTTLANLKENLNKIALDVHDDEDNDYDDDDRLSEISNNDQMRYSINNRRRSVSPVVANGFDSNSQIEQYKAEIKRLQESESQIKALSVNYAALLKEREIFIAATMVCQREGSERRVTMLLHKDEETSVMN
nr:hypothetical protein [Tanacetum cinerariifolium]